MHVVQRGHNRKRVFFDGQDYRVYLRWLRESAAHYRVEIHGWCLMTNHVHLLLTPLEHGALPRLFSRLGCHYVPYVNRRYERTGSLWEGRYRASLIDSESYLLTCMRYIELNPVRAEMVTCPGDYSWSSYGIHAWGEAASLHTPHPVYLALGATALQRQSAYCDLIGEHLCDESIRTVRDALNHNHVLGDEHFKARVEKAVGRRLGTGKPGRPRTSADKDTGADGAHFR